MLVATGIGGTAAFIALWVTLILTASNPEAGGTISSPPPPPHSEAPPAAAPHAPATADEAQPLEWDAVAESV
jgi:hypothetical protein